MIHEATQAILRICSQWWKSNYSVLAAEECVEAGSEK